MNETFWVGVLQALLPAGLVLGAVYMLLKKFFDNEERRRFYELRANNQKLILPIRLQAYERLALLLERLSINNLIMRVKRPGMSAADLQASLINEIRAEYDHNLSQQIYVSNEAWEMVITAKESVTRQINVCYSSLKDGASSIELSKAIFETTMREEMPATYKSLIFIKEEAKQLF